MLWVVIQIFT